MKWVDVTGAPQQGWFEEFSAVVLQHEVEHLEGVTLLDHSSRLKRGRYIARRKKANRKEG
jgi:peptide deformylase